MVRSSFLWLERDIFQRGSGTRYACRRALTFRTKAHCHLNDANNPDRSLLGGRYLVCNSLDGGSVHSCDCRPVHHGLQHQSRPRGEANAEVFPRRASSSGMRGTGTDNHNDGQDGCENSKTAHRSILWRTIRRRCHGSSSKLSEVNKSTQRAKWNEPQPVQNQQIHRAFKNQDVRFRSRMSRSGQASGVDGWCESKF